MPPQDKEKAAVKRVAHEPVQPVDAQRLVRGRIGRPELRQPEKTPAVVSQQGDGENGKPGHRDDVAGEPQPVGETEGRRGAEQVPADRPDRREMKDREPVIGEPVGPPENAVQPGLDAARRENRMGQPERQPRQGVSGVIREESGQDAFIRAMVAVVLKPGTRSASTTRPP